MIQLRYKNKTYSFQNEQEFLYWIMLCFQDWDLETMATEAAFWIEHNCKEDGSYSLRAGAIELDEYAENQILQETH
jgi:hypothetical protein